MKLVNANIQSTTTASSFIPERETRKVAAALVLAARHTTLWQFSLSAAATQTK